MQKKGDKGGWLNVVSYVWCKKCDLPRSLSSSSVCTPSTQRDGPHSSRVGGQRGEKRSTSVSHSATSGHWEAELIEASASCDSPCRQQSQGGLRQQNLA